MSERRFLGADFLLHTDTARRLYHEVAAPLPIVDYHCHLPPAHIATNHRFADMAELWLEGDHYKWRAMRTNGVSERLCTGAATPWEKFEAWAATVPALLRNPLYHWTHLELGHPFGIHGVLLGPDTARSVFARCNEQLAEPDFSTLGLLRSFNVQVVCTTDDPVDSLEHHAALAENASAPRVFPTWRPDQLFEVGDPLRFNAYVDRLEAAAGLQIGSFDELMGALKRRHDHFHRSGCRVSDHGLATVFAEETTPAVVAMAFERLRAGRTIEPHQKSALRAGLLLELARMDHARGWAQQFHLGALRNNNTRMQKLLGADSGFDSIGDQAQAGPLQEFLDRLDRTGQLTRTIIYNSNPRDNEVFASMLGNFQDGSVPGKLQYGSAWWFLDQLDGIEKQLNALSNLGLLSRFVGMVTDSRSFLSYSRHEYFRRIFCNLLGQEIERGIIPSDESLIRPLVEGVCYRNALEYFQFPALERPA